MNSAPELPRAIVALFPAEKGSWAALYEPFLLCLLLAPTLPTAALFVAGLGAFLARQPIRSMFLRGRGANRTMLTSLAALGGVALVALAVAFAWGAPDRRCVAMLTAGAALGALYFVLDARKQGRSLLGELCGALAPLTLAPVALWLSGVSTRLGAIALALLAIRQITTIFYVRYRLRRIKRGAASPAAVLAVHLLALAAIAAMAWHGDLSAAGVLAFLLLLVRFIAGVVRPRPSATARQLGFAEIVVGLLYTLLVAAGIR